MAIRDTVGGTFASVIHTASNRYQEGGITSLIKQKELLVIVVSAVLTLLVIFPFYFILYGSFSLNGIGEEFVFTLQNYYAIATGAGIPGMPNTIIATYNTIYVSIISTVMGIVGGLLMAWIVMRTNTPGVQRFRGLIIFPYFISTFLAGFAWQGIAGEHIGLLNGILTRLGFEPVFAIATPFGIAFVMGIHYIPLAFLLIASSLSNMDASLEEVARICGASRLKVLRKIVVPMMAPAVLGATILIFVLAFSHFGVPAALGLKQGYYVLSTAVYWAVVRDPPAYGPATATAMLLAVFTAGLVAFRLVWLKGKEYTTVRGKAVRPKKTDLGRWKWLSAGFVALYIFLAVILPLFYFGVLTLYKFLVPFPTLEILTLQNWERVLGFGFTWTAIKNSLFLGFIAAAVAILLGLAVSWVVVRTEVRGRQFLDVLATVPIAVPAIVVGIAYLWAALSFPGGFYGSILVIAVALVARYFPYAVRVLDNNIRQISVEMEEVAHTAGADWQTTFRKIVIPLLRPGIAASFVLLYASFVRSITIPALLYTGESTVTSTLMLSLWFDGNLSQVAVIGVIQLFMIVIGIVIFMKVFKINLDDVTAR